jgi:hypothetical protein
MEFIWHDGGRAACGFVGSAGDCVPRAIAIATGEVYRDVYDLLSERSRKTARNGVVNAVFREYLAESGWKASTDTVVTVNGLPKGVVIVEFKSEERKRHGHLSCVIDHTVYDTWNPFEDASYQVEQHWTLTPSDAIESLPIRAPGARPVSDQAKLTQHEFERILKRVKALHRTASNEASTEGEVRNALRAMQALMLQHNLDRKDIVEEDNVSGMGMTRRACPLNGRRSCQWETALAHYVTKHIFPMVQYYVDRRGHRTLYWFYGPVDDVAQTLGLFQEMLLTIATTARLKYGGYSRGSGASYAEGYVAGLPREEFATASHVEQSASAVMSGKALVHTRMLAIQSAASEWLDVECGIRLVRSSGYSGRYSFDWSAHREGTRDGAKHDTSHHHARKRLPKA